MVHIFEKILISIKKHQEELLVANNQIFDSLKYSRFDKLPDKTKEQVKLIKLLEQEKEQLKEKVNQYSITKGVPFAKLSEILVDFPQMEKEKLLDIQREIVSLEREVTNSLYRNERFLSVMISSKEAILDSAIHLNEKESNDSRMFLDEKL